MIFKHMIVIYMKEVSMERLYIQGGEKMYGEMKMYSAKNAVLPILACSIMADGKSTFKNCPDIEDVKNMLLILESLGCSCTFENGTITAEPVLESSCLIEDDLAKTLRSSIFLMGSILARYKKVRIAYPGGCDIGLRPINLHIEGLKALNVKIQEENGYIVCDGSHMRGGVINFDVPSVGATENIMMAATLTKGTTIIKNAAREPEIIDLQNYINKMGGNIRGAGRSCIVIEGVKKLKPCEYTPISDRIVTGTYLIACAMAGGEIEINNVNFEHIYSLISKLRETTCKIHINNDKINIRAPKQPMAMKNVKTSPYPGFPTDLQAQVMTMMTVSKGVSIIEENMFEMRFRHITELIKMGADINVSGKTAVVSGVKKLQGAGVTAYDLRGGSALCLAGLVAEGTTVISDLWHIDRGYESIEKELSNFGVKIQRKGEL